MIFDIFNPYSNTVVADEYISIIQAALEANGNNTNVIKKIDSHTQNNEKGILVVAVKDAIKARRAKYGYVILWVQGIIPEESFLVHKSRSRRLILSLIEIAGLKSADFIFFVSNAMLHHFKKKYGFIAKNYYVMPCLNEEIRDKEPFRQEGKYRNNLFIYAGGTQKWQCFDETIELYSLIEKDIENSSLRILTSDFTTAERVASQYGIKRYSIGYATGEELKKELSKAKFGFSLRKNDPVNNVSTPTKLSTYISNGIIPIYSGYILDFSSLMEGKKYGIRSDDSNSYNVGRIKELCTSNIAWEDVYGEFLMTFGKYYSRSAHLKEINKCFEGQGIR